MFTSAAGRPLEGAVRGLAQTSEQFKDYNPAALRDSSGRLILVWMRLLLRESKTSSSKIHFHT